MEPPAESCLQNRDRRRSWWAATFIALVACLLQEPLFAYVRARTPSGFLFVENGTISFSLNQNYATAPVNAIGAAALEELNRGRLSWNRISTSKAYLREFAMTSVAAANSNDGINIVTFEDTAENNSQVQNIGTRVSSVLATTVFAYQTQPTPGKIVSADIVFNPRLHLDTTAKFFGSDSTRTDIRDMQSIFAHELGHALGADHSGILSATMAPVIKRHDFHQRLLSFDDMAFATDAYPEASAAAALGAIRGRVTKNGSALAAGHVIAYDPDQNILVGGITDTDGTYKITGLVAGHYRIVVEPFDGPVAKDDLKPTLSGSPAYYSAADLSFPTTFRGSATAPTVHSVSSGAELTAIDVDVSGTTAPINATLVARNVTGGVSFTASENSVVAFPGESFDLLVLGTNISTSTVTGVEISGGGITVGSLSNFTSAGADPVSGVKASLEVASTAAPGPRLITLKGATAVLPGGFVIEGKTPPVKTIYFPAAVTGTQQFVGIGLTNEGNNPAVLTYTALDNSGNLVQGPGVINPVRRTVSAGTQLARLAREVLGVFTSDVYDGWLEIKADSANVNGFFLRGDFNLNFLDGSDAGSRTGAEWYLTDVRKSSDTEILIVNPGHETAQVTIQYVRENGPSASTSATIPPGGRFQQHLSKMFGVVLGLTRDQGFLKITADKPVTASSQFQDGNTIFFLNGQLNADFATSLVVPHFAVGDVGVTMSSTLVLDNPSSSAATVTIEVFNDAGTKVGEKAETILANGQKRVNVGSILTTPTTQGSIVINSSLGILGNIVFWADNQVLAAALPLVGTSNLPRRALFAHLATALGFFHGVAVINPATSGTLTGKIKVFDETGKALGEESFALTPKQRKVGLIGTNFIPAAAHKAAGYIIVEADGAFSAFSLFGRGDLQFMAAVPPNKLN